MFVFWSQNETNTFFSSDKVIFVRRSIGLMKKKVWFWTFQRKLSPEEGLDGGKRRAATSQWCCHPSLLQNFLLQNIPFLCFSLSPLVVSLVSSVATFTFFDALLHIFFLLLHLNIPILALAFSHQPHPVCQPPMILFMPIPQSLKIIVTITSSRSNNHLVCSSVGRSRVLLKLKQGWWQSGPKGHQKPLT